MRIAHGLGLVVMGIGLLACSSGSGGGGSPGSGGNSGNGFGGSGFGGNGFGGNAGSTSSGGSSAGGGGAVTAGTPTSLEAQAVGAYAQYGSSCTSGSAVQGFAAFLCPGGRIRAAGKFTNATELMCGSYTTKAATYSNCNDKVGCFPKVNASVKDTLIIGGQSDVANLDFTMLMVEGDSGTELMRPTVCGDNSSGWVYLARVAGDVGEDYCVSDACPAPGGSSGGGYGQCGTDCDCGECWYCESGTCRYGGEGPYGCYRGCSG